MIHIENLKKKYSGQVVLDVAELNILAGESFGLVGNNGAGKTTLFRSLLDLIKVDSGMISIHQIPVIENEAWKRITGSYLDQGFLIDFLSPEEFFNFTGRVKGMTSDEINDFLNEMEEFFNHEILGKKKLIRNLSMGNQQKIGIAAALMGNPELVLLDEPFNSIDPTTQIRLKNLIRRKKTENNITFLISSHDLNHITEVCDRIVVLENGLIKYDIKTSIDTLASLESYFAV
ncbi:MAG: ATP-binding protein [Bacteroidetes bacterium HGW-Bacteroidetes-1]|jgi:ABC-2 type transport system ATP-binding protein|nr:MAG: ATP-binding protein [Bacteroidetes bacterium HGW-Bacteroidetes-1]